MVEGSAEAGADNALVRAYHAAEQRYYALVDGLEARGVPARTRYANPLDQHGIPSFPFTLALLAALALALWLLFAGPSGPGDVIIRVTDSAGAPIAGAAVLVSGPGLDQTLVTSGEGRVFFPELESSVAYAVTVQAEGFVTQDVRVRPIPGATTERTVVLRRPGETGVSGTDVVTCGFDGQVCCATRQPCAAGLRCDTAVNRCSPIACGLGGTFCQQNFQCCLDGQCKEDCGAQGIVRCDPPCRAGEICDATDTSNPVCVVNSPTICDGVGLCASTQSCCVNVLNGTAACRSACLQNERRIACQPPCPTGHVCNATNVDRPVCEPVCTGGRIPVLAENGSIVCAPPPHCVGELECACRPGFDPCDDGLQCVDGACTYGEACPVVNSTGSGVQYCTDYQVCCPSLNPSKYAGLGCKPNARACETATLCLGGCTDAGLFCDASLLESPSCKGVNASAQCGACPDAQCAATPTPAPTASPQPTIDPEAFTQNCPFLWQQWLSTEACREALPPDQWEQCGEASPPVGLCEDCGPDCSLGCTPAQITCSPSCRLCTLAASQAGACTCGYGGQPCCAAGPACAPGYTCNADTNQCAVAEYTVEVGLKCSRDGVQTSLGRATFQLDAIFPVDQIPIVVESTGDCGPEALMRIDSPYAECFDTGRVLGRGAVSFNAMRSTCPLSRAIGPFPRGTTRVGTLIVACSCAPGLDASLELFAHTEPLSPFAFAPLTPHDVRTGYANNYASFLTFFFSYYQQKTFSLVLQKTG